MGEAVKHSNTCMAVTLTVSDWRTTLCCIKNVTTFSLIFTKQYVACGKICHFLCFVISQGKVVALDR